MMSSVLHETVWLAVILTVGGAVGLAAGGLSVWSLYHSRRDLRWVREAGFGNGRLAAAIGEHRLGWLRLGQAAVALLLTGIFVWMAVFHAGPTVQTRWMVVAMLTVSWNALVGWAAWEADKTRRHVLRLGIAEEGDLPGPDLAPR